MQILQYRYTPNEKQLDFHRSKAKYRAYIGGIRSGKTYSGAWECLRHLVKYPRSTYLVISPTYGMMQDSTLHTFMDICPLDLIARRKDGSLAIDATRHNIKMYNGSEVKFRSADDPDKIRGMEVSGFWLDEGGQLSDDEMWKIGIGRMSQKSAPRRAICTTTPSGMNWMYDFFILRHNPECEVFYARTIDNKMNLPSGYIESLESQYTGNFLKQELLGEFVGYEGLVYPEFTQDVHVTDDMPEYMDDRIKKVEAGQDFGYTNPTSTVIVGTDRAGNKYVYDEFYESGQPFDVYKPEITKMLQKYCVRKVYCDPSSPDLIAMLNNTYNRQFEAFKGNNDIMSGVIAVSQYLKVQSDGKPRIFIHPRCKNLINEFQLYRYAAKRDNEKNKSEVPLKKYDHALDALRYVLNNFEDNTRKSDRFLTYKRSNRGW